MRRRAARRFRSVTGLACTFAAPRLPARLRSMVAQRRARRSMRYRSTERSTTSLRLIWRPNLFVSRLASAASRDHLHAPRRTAAVTRGSASDLVRGRPRGRFPGDAKRSPLLRNVALFILSTVYVLRAVFLPRGTPGSSLAPMIRSKIRMLHRSHTASSVAQLCDRAPRFSCSDSLTSSKPYKSGLASWTC